MSIEAVTWALSAPVSGSAKVILLGFANHAHPDGSESYPSLATLAKYGNCDRSTARRNIRKLVDDGWLVPAGKGPQGQRKFRLPLDRIEGVADCHGGVALLPAGGGTAARLGVAPMPPEPSSNHPETNSPRAHEREAAPEGTSSPSSIVDERRALADHVRGILQRGVDGLTTDEYCKPVGRGAVIAAIGDAPWELAEAAAIEARSIAQAQNRAPNIVALFAAKLKDQSKALEAA